MLNKTYQPKEIESKNYNLWEKSDSFKPKKNYKDSYTIMMPPPNVTGRLHIGHALNYTLQDILIRYYRIKGKSVLWQPGMDHAGIATQMVVENKLLKKRKTKQDLGRDEFIKEVWKWKEESGGKISYQQRKLGITPDWSCDRFTMDEHYKNAVKKVFIDFYKEGLIYRDKRLVNWDPELLTALSDLEINNIETEGNIWYLQYPLLDNPKKFITIATTRPETIFGDSGIAVNPNDDRYKNLIGKKAILPIVNRTITIVADNYSDPKKGSGAVKITPAHDFNDFEVGKRHNFKIIDIFDIHARLNKNTPINFQGLGRFEARKQVIDFFKDNNLLNKIEKTKHIVPYGERSGEVLEPKLTEQWFVDAKKLATRSIKVVKEKKIKFHPQNWESTYFNWLKDIQPWCISRQIWWGHRIPAWYSPDGKVFVCSSKKEALKEAEKFFGHKVTLSQDEDVLDTWFSSSLWPFVTLGWPEKTIELKNRYPGNVLITGFDLIFFWVARMTMMGLHIMKDIPFKNVVFHALVLDEHGQKMSKSRGNIIDPLEIMNVFGADAFRFALASSAVPGSNINFSSNQVKGYRNFATKLWNVARFYQQNKCSHNENYDINNTKFAINQWIASKIIDVKNNVDKHLKSYRFDLAANVIYQFIWSEFCDWYIELTKPILYGNDNKLIEETKSTLSWSLENILLILHPFMPFITEELWLNFSFRKTLLIESTFNNISYNNLQAKKEIKWLIGIVSSIRTIRSETNIPHKTSIKLGVDGCDKTTKIYLEKYESFILKLAHVKSISFDTSNNINFKKNVIQFVYSNITLSFPTEGIINIKEEIDRITKSISKIDTDINLISKQLKNKNFLDNAPKTIIEKNKHRISDITLKKNKLLVALDRLKLTKS